jgi:hypothetical protein
VTSANEFPDSAEDRLGESFAVGQCRAEFEWRTKSIGNGCTDDCADHSLKRDGVDGCGDRGYFDSFWVRSGVHVGSVSLVGFHVVSPSGYDNVNARTAQM